MGSMNIAIKKEAYDFLKKLKGDDKSFSDVILSFKKQDVMHLFGKLKDQNWKEKEKKYFFIKKRI